MGITTLKNIALFNLCVALTIFNIKTVSSIYQNQAPKIKKYIENVIKKEKN